MKLIVCINLLFLSLYITTQWGEVLLEELIVAQLVNKFPAFYETVKVHYLVHKSGPRGPTRVR
jgi:hypothetical protein